MAIQVPITGEAPNLWAVSDTVMAVGPKGETVTRHIFRLAALKDQDIGDTPIKVRDGRPYIDPDYEAKGWVMYEDLCKGRVEGVAADMPRWQLWQLMCQEKAKGRRIPSSAVPADYLHPEVIRRREEQGTNSLTRDELRDWAVKFGIVSSVPSESDLAAKLAELQAQQSEEPKKGKK